jgi:hypothetical protein
LTGELSSDWHLLAGVSAGRMFQLKLRIAAIFNHLLDEKYKLIQRMEPAGVTAVDMFDSAFEARITAPGHLKHKCSFHNSILR